MLSQMQSDAAVLSVPLPHVFFHLIDYSQLEEIIIIYYF